MAVSQRQLEANGQNWAKRGPLTDDGQRRIGEAARRWKPWEHSTGPRTSAGKARSRMNALKDDGEEVGVHDSCMAVRTTGGDGPPAYGESTVPLDAKVEELRQTGDFGPPE